MASMPVTAGDVSRLSGHYGLRSVLFQTKFEEYMFLFSLSSNFRIEDGKKLLEKVNSLF
jgi:hypothetical protein